MLPDYIVAIASALKQKMVTYILFLFGVNYWKYESAVGRDERQGFHPKAKCSLDLVWFDRSHDLETTHRYGGLHT